MKHLCMSAAASATLFFALPASAAAQDSLPVSPDQRVRIQTSDAERHIGRVQAIEGDTLLLRSKSESPLRPIPVGSIVRLDIRERASSLHGAWKWAKRGFLVGAVTGAVTCGVEVEQCRESPEMKDYEIILGSALFLGGGTAFLGAIGGAIFPGNRWQQVPLPEQTHFMPTENGGLSVLMSWKF